MINYGKANLIKRGRTERAFSLLEILIVIVLLAGIMSVTVPVAFRSLEVSLNRTMRDIAAFTENLRFFSILQNRHFQLVFDFDEHSAYAMAKIDGKWQRIDGEFKPIELKEGINFRYFKKGPTLITAYQAKINILPFGYIDTFQITLQQESDNMLFRVETVLGQSTLAQDDVLFY